MKIESSVIDGASVTASGTVVGFAANAVPVLQAVSLTVAIIVGILTGLLTFVRIRKERKK